MLGLLNLKWWNLLSEHWVDIKESVVYKYISNGNYFKYLEILYDNFTNDILLNTIPNVFQIKLDKAENWGVYW